MLDIRSPGEYAKGHIPGALCFPLFTNEERATVGTLYKQQGHDHAVRAGLEMVAPKMVGFVDSARELMGSAEAINLYCWRGGMRSGSMAWLLSTAGLPVNILTGGYKAFRGEVRRSLASDGKLLILGGYTGSAKTRILQLMQERGAQAIDLEGLANHKGSAFGNLLDEPQPSSEHFSNLVWQELQAMDYTRPIWLEDESRHIGRVWLDLEFAKRLETGRVIALQRSRSERAEFLVEDYGTIPSDILANGFKKIANKMGGQNLKAATAAVAEGDLQRAADLGLAYYDKTYEYGLRKRDSSTVERLDVIGWSNEQIADHLVANQNQWTPLT